MNASRVSLPTCVRNILNVFQCMCTCSSLYPLYIGKLQLNINHVITPGVGLLKMFESQLHTDVTFQVGGQRVLAHRLVLASQSDYFDCLLYGPMMEGRASEITLKETPVDAFRELLKFVYSGSVSSMNLTVRLLCSCRMCSICLLCILYMYVLHEYMYVCLLLYIHMAFIIVVLH